MRRLHGIGVAAFCLSLALLACNVSPGPPAPVDDVPTLGTLVFTRVPTLVPASATPTHTPTNTPIPPTPTPQATNTPEPTQPPTAAPAAQPQQAQPAQPAAPPPPTSPPVDPSAGQPFDGWWHIEGLPTMHEDNRASHALYISARGGTGVYRYYWNGEEFAGPVKTVIATLCTYVVGTARIEDTGGNVKDIAVGFTAFCPTPFGCNDCELWRP